MKRFYAKAALSAALLGGLAATGQAGPLFGQSSNSNCPCNSPYAAHPVVQEIVPVAVSPTYGQITADTLPIATTEAEATGATMLPQASISLHADSPAIEASNGIPSVRLANSRGLVLNFDVKGVGTSGVGNVELWYTRNGQVWQKYQAGAQTQSPFAIEVPEDGLYGFSAVAVSGVGISKTRPQPGDVPQVWIEVDTTKPDVRILGTQAGVDEEGRTLVVRWSATDKNLGARPITLYYAGQGQSTWTPFATNLPNTGHFTWRLSPGLPPQVLVRVEATDRVGNCGADQTNMPSPIDLARPAAVITGIGRNGVIQASGTNP